ncbi:MAG: SH3 domain-containing protein, partial [Chloroflexales bacterium]
VSGGVPLTQLPTVTLPPPTPTGPRRFVVQNTGIEGLLLRPAPSRANDPLATLPDGTVVEQIDEDLTAEAIAWRHVRAADGQEGYVAADFLTPAP